MSGDVFKQATPMKRRKLSDEHRRHLVDGSGILPGIVNERGYYTLKSSGVKILIGEKILREDAIDAESWLGIPIFRPDGNYYGDIIRLFGAPDHIPKYLWPKGFTQAVDVHPSMQQHLANPDYAVLFTEGVKKEDAILSRALMEGIKVIPVGLNGCWGWQASTTSGAIACPDFRDIPMKKRILYVNSDSDWKTNDTVRKGWSEAALYFSSKMDKSPDGEQERAKSLIVVTPSNGTDKQGADDYFLAGGTLAGLLAEATTPALALLESRPRPDDDGGPRPIAFRTGIEVVRSAPERVDYLMEPLVSAGSINLWAGHSGTYKTWHALSFILDGAFGYQWSDHPATKLGSEPFTSILVNKEMSGGMLDVRLKQLAKHAKYSDHPDFADILNERIILVEEAEIDLKEEAQRNRIEEFIRDIGAKVIVLDSFSMSWTGDENSAQEVAEFYKFMRGITERTGVAWILVHHLVKPPQGNRKDQGSPSRFSVRGSGQIIAQADSALLFSTIDKDDPGEPSCVSITHTKTRTTAEMPTWVSLFGDNDGLFTSLTYSGLLSERLAQGFANSHGDSTKFAAWVKAALENMPVMHQTTGPGLRMRNLIVLLKNAWNVKDVAPPSDSTFRRHLENMMGTGELEMLDENKRLGNQVRLRYDPILSADEEEPDYSEEEEDE